MDFSEFGVKADHIGYAVNDLDRISDFYASLGFSLGPVEDVPSLRQRMRIIEKDGLKIEFLAPYDGTRAGIQHTAYICRDIDGAFAHAKESGCRIAVPVTRFGNRRFFFFSDPEGCYVEFMEYDAKEEE